MGNFCSIFHNNYERLLALTNNHNKAVFLDKCIFWWQISNYRLNDNKIWFTRKLSDIAKDLLISERSVSRYLEQLEEQGLVERTCKLSASNKNNQFKVSKKLYIRITEKLINLLQLNPISTSKESKACDSSFYKQGGEIENDNLSVSIYKDNNHNNNNIVSHEDIVNNFQNNSNQPLKPQTKPLTTPQIYPIEPVIGECITPALKNYIKGMLVNVQKQHGVNLSNPNKVFAEVVFSVTQETQWQGISHAHHRVNIIAKLLRQRAWKTPKGFYNHWEIGQHFKTKEQQQLTAIQQQKLDDSVVANKLLSQNEPSESDLNARFNHGFESESSFNKQASYNNDAKVKKQKSLLEDIAMSLRAEESYFKQLSLLQEQNHPSVNEALVESVAMKIAKLYEQKQSLQDSINEILQAA